MFGNTFGNLDNELTFVHESLSDFAPGDFFLLSVSQIYAAADQPTRIKAMDPRLSGQLHGELLSIDREWFFGLVRTYGRIDAAAEMTMYTQLNFHVCPVPGSYAVETIVEVLEPSGARRHISMDYIKRYDSQMLTNAMAECGWEIRESWCSNHWLLHLYERRDALGNDVHIGAPNRNAS
jgi:hypothetical protein